MDEFGRFLNIITIILLVVSIFVKWYLFLHCLYWDTLISGYFQETMRQEVRKIRNIVQYGIATEEAATGHTAVITRIQAVR